MHKNKPLSYRVLLTKSKIQHLTEKTFTTLKLLYFCEIDDQWYLTAFLSATDIARYLVTLCHNLQIYKKFTGNIKICMNHKIFNSFNNAFFANMWIINLLQICSAESLKNLTKISGREIDIDESILQIRKKQCFVKYYLS